MKVFGFDWKKVTKKAKRAAITFFGGQVFFSVLFFFAYKIYLIIYFLHRLII